MSRKANFLQRAEDFCRSAISTETKSADSFNAKNSRQVTFRAVWFYHFIKLPTDTIGIFTKSQRNNQSNRNNQTTQKNTKNIKGEIRYFDLPTRPHGLCLKEQSVWKERTADLCTYWAKRNSDSENTEFERTAGS